MSNFYSSGNRGQTMPRENLEEEIRERRSGASAKTDPVPRRRFYDNRFNQLKWPLFVFSWFLVGLAIVALFLTT